MAPAAANARPAPPKIDKAESGLGEQSTFKKVSAATRQAAQRAHHKMDDVGTSILASFQSQQEHRGRQGYDGRNAPGSMMQSFWLLFRMKGSVFPRILLPSLVAGCSSAILVMGTGEEGEEGWLPFKPLRELLIHPYGHQIFALTVGYALVVRFQLAYSRWWEALDHIHTMWSRLADACTQVTRRDARASHDAPMRHSEPHRVCLPRSASPSTTCPRARRSPRRSPSAGSWCTCARIAYGATRGM
jgi:hypothetical protein